jgi:protein-S-isoprenylcysteine O-methyltransferase Ste14
MGVTLGFFSPWAVDAIVLALHLLLPARKVNGYVRGGDGKPLRYRLNGLRVLLVVLLLYGAAARFGLISWDFFFLHRWESLAGACTLGVLFTLAIVLGPPSTGKPVWADLYLGRRENPQWVSRAGTTLVDAKMVLYLIGAVQLELNVLSFAAHQALAHPGALSPGVVVYAALFTFFVCEYLFFEEVHLYTYDFIAERVGFKLGWGCIAFYPYFYCVGLWAVAGKPDPHRPWWLLALSLLVFFAGWAFSRGANLQKFLFKTRPEAKLFGVLLPEVVSDGEHRLLCGGFWRLARHINYFGEILMALGLTLALGWPLVPWPWLYPLYYVALLFPRQRDDDARCAKKYGSLWKEYCRRVPYRIIPGIY